MTPLSPSSIRTPASSSAATLAAPPSTSCASISPVKESCDEYTTPTSRPGRARLARRRFCSDSSPTMARSTINFIPNAAAGEMGHSMTDLLHKIGVGRPRRHYHRPSGIARLHLQAAQQDLAGPSLDLQHTSCFDGHVRRRIFPSESELSDDDDSDAAPSIVSASDSSDVFEDADDGSDPPDSDGREVFSSSFSSLPSLRDLLRLIVLLFLIGGIYVANQAPHYAGSSPYFPSVATASSIPNRFSGIPIPVADSRRLQPKYRAGSGNVGRVLGPCCPPTSPPVIFPKVGRSTSTTLSPNSTSPSATPPPSSTVSTGRTTTVRENFIAVTVSENSTIVSVPRAIDEATSKVATTGNITVTAVNGTESSTVPSVDSAGDLNVVHLIIGLVVAAILAFIFICGCIALYNYSDALGYEDVALQPVRRGAPAGTHLRQAPHRLRCASGFHSQFTNATLEQVSQLDGKRRLCQACYREACRVLLERFRTNQLAKNNRLGNERLLRVYSRFFQSPDLHNARRYPTGDYSSASLAFLESAALLKPSSSLVNYAQMLDGAVDSHLRRVDFLFQPALHETSIGDPDLANPVPVPGPGQDSATVAVDLASSDSPSVYYSLPGCSCAGACSCATANTATTVSGEMGAGHLESSVDLDKTLVMEDRSPSTTTILNISPQDPAVSQGLLVPGVASGTHTTLLSSGQLDYVTTTNAKRSSHGHTRVSSASIPIPKLSGRQ